MPFPDFSDQGAAAIRRAGELARSGGVNPAHLLAAVLEVSGPLGEMAAVVHAPPGPKARQHDPAATEAVVHFDTLARQAISSAGAWARRRGTRAGPEDLLVLLVDQHSPPVVAALARMGPDSERLRPAALRMLGLPGQYGPVQLEPVPPAGMMDDRSLLDISDLPADVWAVLPARQGRLPLHRVRRRSDWAAVVINEQRAVLKMAARRNLADDERHAFLHHHRRAVQRRGTEVVPHVALEPAPAAGAGPLSVHRSDRHRMRLVPPGWVVWFGNRRTGLKVAWFRWTAQRY